jgi:plasmid maintenance system antidote protein VapI
VLLKDFIEPLGLTRYRSRRRSAFRSVASTICSGRVMSADTALRLGRFFSVEPQL